MATQAEPQSPSRRTMTKERVSFLVRIDRAMEGPLIVLGFLWLVLLVAQLVFGSNGLINTTTYVVWAIFLVDFGIRLIVAPSKVRFLKRNWLVAVSLVLPALSVFRLTRILAMMPSWQVVIFRLLTGVNRTITVLGSTMRRRGLGYVLTLSILVTLAGAAGMYALEPHSGDGNGIPTFGYAVWWTAMIMTTLGSSYFPQTWGGRVLCFLLAVFAFSIFGYITAAIASYFVNKDADDASSDVASEKTIKQILHEVQSLRSEVSALRTLLTIDR